MEVKTTTYSSILVKPASDWYVVLSRRKEFESPRGRLFPVDAKALNNEAFESTPTTRKGERKRDTIK